jgi:pyridoxamine 5'-phosphate oxidase
LKLLKGEAFSTCLPGGDGSGDKVAEGFIYLIMKEIRNYLRSNTRQYTGAFLDPSNAHHDPFAQMQQWMKEAIAFPVTDANTMMLSTCGEDGVPAGRIVLLKDITDRGFSFYTSYNSSKSKDICHNPKGSLLFYWPEMMRQVRIEGNFEKLSVEESEIYFRSRPRESQIAAIVSQQSSEIESRDDLMRKYDAIDRLFAGKEIPYPSFWGGYLLLPFKFEFWQGQANRLHDRIQYKLDPENNWKISRLSP